MFYPPCIQLASRYDSLNWIKHTNLHELDVLGKRDKHLINNTYANENKLKTYSPMGLNVGIKLFVSGLQELKDQLRDGQYHLPMGVDGLASRA